MTLRSLALVLTLVFVATPLVGAVCEMDCDQPPAVSGCHESTLPDEPTLRAAHHACGHDHTTGSPALLAGTSARDSIATLIAITGPVLAHAWKRHAILATAAAMDGPVGVGTRSTSSGITILRI